MDIREHVDLFCNVTLPLVC